MKANEIERGELLAWLETPAGRSFLAERDYHWNTVMRKAREAGFIIQAYGGTAVLCTHDAMWDAEGAEGVARMLAMNAADVPMEV